jgi:hypothetical protein
MESVKLFIIIIIIFSLYINGRILSYLYSLEDIDCKCALLDERKFIIFYTLYSIIITFIFIVVSICNPKLIASEDMYLMSVANKFLSFINVIVTIFYLNRLRRCPCSASPTKSLMFFITIGAILSYLYMIIFGK